MTFPTSLLQAFLSLYGLAPKPRRPPPVAIGYGLRRSA